MREKEETMWHNGLPVRDWEEDIDSKGQGDICQSYAHWELVSDREKPKPRKNSSAEVFGKEQKPWLQVPMGTKMQAVLSPVEDWKKIIAGEKRIRVWITTVILEN